MKAAGAHSRYVHPPDLHLGPPYLALPEAGTRGRGWGWVEGWVKGHQERGSRFSSEDTKVTKFSLLQSTLFESPWASGAMASVCSSHLALCLCIVLCRGVGR